jgi:hypothetical protein
MICTYFSRLLNNAIDDYSEEDDSSLLGKKPKTLASFIHGVLMSPRHISGVPS